MGPEDADDESLMNRFCNGEESAFEALFSRHAPRVRAYLSRLTSSPEMADDLTQVTFLSLVRSRGRYASAMRFTPWLYAIATNVARDHHRRQVVDQRRKEGFKSSNDEANNSADDSLAESVSQALTKLPSAQRSAVVLHRFEGLSFKEIAQVEGTTESAVKVRAHRGYESLRKLLSPVWKELES